MKEKLQQLLGEEITRFELKGKGACNNAYYVETESGKRLIIKEERPDKELSEQNVLHVEAELIRQLSALHLATPIPKVVFVEQNPEVFGYEFIEGERLYDVWKDFSEAEREAICHDLGAFHAEIGTKVRKEVALATGIKLNPSSGLHPQVEEEYHQIQALTDIPEDFKLLARKAKKIFNETLDLGVFQFLHNDCHPQNIISKDKKIAGIIDFGDSEYGEIAKEFSRYIRDFPDHFDHIVRAYENISGNKLSRERLITNSYLSGLIDRVKAYRKGGEDRAKAVKAVAKYKELMDRF